MHVLYSALCACVCAGACACACACACAFVPVHVHMLHAPWTLPCTLLDALSYIRRSPLPRITALLHVRSQAAADGDFYGEEEGNDASSSKWLLSHIKPRAALAFLRMCTISSQSNLVVLAAVCVLTFLTFSTFSVLLPQRCRVAPF